MFFQLTAKLPGAWNERTIMYSMGNTITPKTAIPGIGYFCYCVDTEGNVFGIMESNPKAG